MIPPALMEELVQIGIHLLSIGGGITSVLVVIQLGKGLWVGKRFIIEANQNKNPQIAIEEELADQIGPRSDN